MASRFPVAGAAWPQAAGPGRLPCQAMPTPDELKQRIEAAIPGASAEVASADNVHFSARVVSAAFADKSRIQQHRMVYDVFDGQLGGEIHALELKTEVP